MIPSRDATHDPGRTLQAGQIERLQNVAPVIARALTFLIVFNTDNARAGSCTLLFRPHRLRNI